MKTDYIEKRLKGQMDYYSKKSAKSRKEYYWMSTILIVINALIPVLSLGIESTGIQKYIVAALGSASTIISSVLLLRKPKDTWIKYRSTYEKLKKEKILFETSSGKYKNGTEEEFILTCEEIMESEQNTGRIFTRTAKTRRSDYCAVSL